MIRGYRWLPATFRIALVVAAAGLFATAAGQTSGAAGAARAHPARSLVSAPARCSRRNKAVGSARVSAHFLTMTTDSFNPYQSGNSPRFNPPGLFESYFVYSNTLKLLPQMAQDIPTVNNRDIRNGGRTVVIHLKRGMRWSNGTEITSADARFGWRIDRDRATGPACTGACAQISAITTPDRYTFVLHLSRVSPQLIPDGLPHIWPTRWPGAWNGNPHVVAVTLAQDPTFTFKGPSYPTDGPYQVTSVVDGKQIVLEPMKYYSTMTCGAYIKMIIATLYPSIASQIAAAAEGKLDQWEGTSLALDALPEIQRHTDAYTVHLDPLFSLERVEFNIDPSYGGAPNPLHEAKVRLALALAVDKLHLAQTGAGLTRREAQSILAWTPWLNTPKLARRFADKTINGQWDPLAHAYLSNTGHGRALVDARRLLASTRWKNGFSITFLTTGIPRSRLEVAALAAAWAPLGVSIQATYVPNPFKLFDTWNNGGLAAHGAFQALLDAHPLNGTDSDVLGQTMESSNIDRRHSDHTILGFNYSGIDDPVIDGAFRAAARTVDNRVRYQHYAAIQRRMNTQAYWIPLYFPPDVWTGNGHIRNTSRSVTAGLYWNVWAWRLKRGHLGQVS